uniref:Putative secreted protein n=1 Tax=Amblyomma americanum TaxID=6943 RepID=A0A0C9RW32_AMBAM
MGLFFSIPVNAVPHRVLLALLSVPSYNLVLALHGCQPTADDSGGEVLSRSFLPKLEEGKSSACLEGGRLGWRGQCVDWSFYHFFFPRFICRRHLSKAWQQLFLPPIP